MNVPEKSLNEKASRGIVAPHFSPPKILKSIPGLTGQESETHQHRPAGRSVRGRIRALEDLADPIARAGFAGDRAAKGGFPQGGDDPKAQRHSRGRRDRPAVHRRGSYLRWRPEGFRDVLPIVRKGGIIAFHNICSGPPEMVGGAPSFWKETMGKYRNMSIVRDQSQSGDGMGILFL